MEGRNTDEGKKRNKKREEINQKQTKYQNEWREENYIGTMKIGT